MLNKRGQFSHGDFIIGFVIFTIAILLFFKYSPYLTPKQDNPEELLTEGKSITESLLTQGYPMNWTAGNVVMLGLTNGNSIINNTKLMNFFDIDYQETRNLFKTRYDYYLYLTHKNDSIIDINGTVLEKGYPGVNQSNINSIETEKLTKITRLSIYNSEIVKMVLLLW